MSSSSSLKPERGIDGMAHFFPDLAPAEPCGASHPGGNPQADDGGFCSLMRQREKTMPNPEAILAAAEARAKTIEAEAHAAGFAKGTAEARAMVEKDFESLFAAFHSAMSDISDVKADLEQQAEVDAVTLAFAIARQVVCHEIETRKEMIFGVIHEALKQVPDPQSATVRISPADYERIKGRAVKLSDDALEEVRMAPDKSIRDGDCVIDTPSGWIDARIEKRIQAVEAALKSRLEHALHRKRRKPVRTGGKDGD